MVSKIKRQRNVGRAIRRLETEHFSKKKYQNGSKNIEFILGDIDTNSHNGKSDLLSQRSMTSSRRNAFGLP